MAEDQILSKAWDHKSNFASAKKHNFTPPHSWKMIFLDVHLQR